ncbi:hypothetical protein RB653_003560 [Dictyostelium firmibasis]|uniref:Uncharacterized protein n=1 Tax=Dictyostelium firmibasis TaxID=79012 RepID=A0AAN7TXX1_9MYCE
MDTDNINSTLNYLTYIDIQPYLLYDESFKRILELSLLSKSIFKSTQQIITHQQQLIKFFPSINTIFNYIKVTDYKNERDFIHEDLIQSKEESDEIDEKYEKTEENEENKDIEPVLKKRNIESNDSNGSDDDNKYEYKLIQYKDIKNLYCNGGKRFNKKTKEILLEKFGNKLKHVILTNRIFADSYQKNPTCDGFFKFNKLRLFWDRESFPFSYPDENEDEDTDLEETFEYSFNFLKRYKPKDIKIETTYSDMELQIKSLEKILKCKSIEKIKFGYHDTPSLFFKQIITCKPPPSIKSLKVRLVVGDEDDDDNDDNNNEEADSEKNDKMVGKLFQDCEFPNNTTLKELILLDTINFTIRKNPSYLLESLIGNKTLTTLGLTEFELWGENSTVEIKEFSSRLSPLLKIPTITTLHCQLGSLITFLQHCNENPMIKTLMITKGFNNRRSDSQSYYDDYKIQFISNFFKENKSLEKLVIKEKYFKQLLEIFNNSGSKIIIKFMKKKKKY